MHINTGVIVWCLALHASVFHFIPGAHQRHKTHPIAATCYSTYLNNKRCWCKTVSHLNQPPIVIVSCCCLVFVFVKHFFSYFAYIYIHISLFWFLVSFTSFVKFFFFPQIAYYTTFCCHCFVCILLSPAFTRVIYYFRLFVILI